MSKLPRALGLAEESRLLLPSSSVFLPPSSLHVVDLAEESRLLLEVIVDAAQQRTLLSRTTVRIKRVCK